MPILSQEQLPAITRTGNFVLIACPGSGKTLTVSNRFFQRMKDWEKHSVGIATLSFTNVAHFEISNNLVEYGLSPTPPFPHFLGTIDHFINTYIFLPFGHLVTGCSDRPNIIGMGTNIWNQEELNLYWGNQTCHSCSLENFSYDIQGNLIGGLTTCCFNYTHCRNLKSRFNRMGLATQLDAEYFAMRILESYPGIARSLSSRFPEMIIDEAQDTSEIQMRIIDLLVMNGLTEVMLVGDPDQAIYEWRDARPDIFMRKMNQAGWGEPVYLTQNRRSSQLICDFTKNFSSSLQNISLAVGTDATFDLPPKLATYEPDDLTSIKTDFINLCERQGLEINPVNIAILVRTNRQLSKLRNIPDMGDPWNHVITRLLAQCAYYRDKGDMVRSHKSSEFALIRIMFGDRYISKLDLENNIDARDLNPNWSLGIWQIIKLLPNSNNVLRLWLNDGTRMLKEWFDAHPSWNPVDRNNLNLRVKQYQMINRQRFIGYYDESITRLFTDSEFVIDGITIETIHAAKGKTYEAVLYIVNDAVKGRAKGNISQISNNDLNSEEVRTAYVAMTRPRKILVIGIPVGTNENLLRNRFPDFMIRGMNTSLNEFGLT